MPVASKNSADVIQGCPQKRRPSQFIVTAHLLSRSLASLCAALQFCSSAEQRLSLRRQARQGGECAECSGIADILGPVQSITRVVSSLLFALAYRITKTGRASVCPSRGNRYPLKRDCNCTTDDMSKTVSDEFILPYSKISKVLSLAYSYLEHRA